MTGCVIVSFTDLSTFLEDPVLKGKLSSGRNQGMRKTTGISKTALSAKHMIIPTVIIIILMHALIVLNTFRINNMGNVIAEETQRNFRLGAISNSFSQSTDAMGGTALSFVNSGEETELQGYFDQFGQTQGNYEAMQKLLEQQRQAEIQQTSRLMPHAQAAVGEGAEHPSGNPWTR